MIGSGALWFLSFSQNTTGAYGLTGARFTISLASSTPSSSVCPQQGAMSPKIMQKMKGQSRSSGRFMGEDSRLGEFNTGAYN